MYDVTILGSGFAGSIMAMCCSRSGLRTLLIDRRRHPRFAIGESTTPLGDMALIRLSERFDIPELRQMATYGSFKSHFPDVLVGRKRGFSYFAHSSEHAFSYRPDRRDELIVAASSEDSLSDTNWYRPDVDTLLVSLAAKYGVEVREDFDVSIDTTGKKLSLRDIETEFVIDSTGAAGAIGSALGIEQKRSFMTHSYAVYGHGVGLKPWSSIVDTPTDYPYPPENGATHHLLGDGRWMWQLGFDNGITSVGLVSKDPLLEADLIKALSNHPSLAEQTSNAGLAPLPGKILQSGRLQRRWSRVTGKNWLMLPTTAGFIDPLHSTGIAHALSGIEKAMDVLQGNDKDEALSNYENQIARELEWIDNLVAPCYAAIDSFEKWRSACMLYFAASIFAERTPQAGYLGALNDDLFERLTAAAKIDVAGEEPKAYADKIREAIKPYNSIGLMSREHNHVYFHTAAPSKTAGC